MTAASYNDGQSQNTSSQEYVPLPSNQLQYDSSPKSETQSKAPAKGSTEPYQSKPLDEIFSQFVPFNHAENLSQPFEEEIERDKNFIHDHAVELMEIMLETWAWNMSRIAYTTQTESVRMGEQLKATMDTEKEQGMSDSLDPASLRTTAFRIPGTDLFDGICRRLQEFVLRMRSAIDALRGT